MPSTATITAFHSFTALTRIKSAEVNTNFSNFRGHLLPVDPNTATAGAVSTWDLGDSTHNWRRTYTQELVLAEEASGTTPPSGFHAVYIKTADGKAYKKNSAGTESQLGGGALVVTGTPAAPSTITAAGITYAQTGGERQVFYVVGDTTTGTDVTANPQITAATSTSYNLELIVYGTDDDKSVLLEDGNGLSLNGPMTLYNKSMLGLLWNGTTWAEMFRKV